MNEPLTVELSPYGITKKHSFSMMPKISTSTGYFKIIFFLEGLEQCVDRCSETCPDVDLKQGCNMQYSCAHACKIRDLGESKESCKQNCNNPGSCYPAFNGHQFNLCTSCKNRKPHVANPPGQCAHVWKEHQKRIDECESGCSFYKRKPIMGNNREIHKV